MKKEQAPFFTEYDFQRYLNPSPYLQSDPLTLAERLSKVANAKIAPVLAALAQAQEENERSAQQVAWLEEALTAAKDWIWQLYYNQQTQAAVIPDCPYKDVVFGKGEVNERGTPPSAREALSEGKE